MREERIYIAEDGKKFDNRLACLKYEKSLSLNEFKGVMLDKDFCPTDHEKVRQRTKKKDSMDLNSIISYLGEKGVNAETLKTICDQLGNQESKKQPASNDSIADPPKKEEKSEADKLKD